MDGPGLFFALLGFVMHEALLLAACGFLLLGASDLAVDAIWIGGTLKRRFGAGKMLCVDGLAPAREPGLIAVFVPAWDEGEVIGSMLANTLAAWGAGDYIIFVGAYPNDPATSAAVRAVQDPRIRLVVGPLPGQTTKADCLNRLWEAGGRAADRPAREGDRAARRRGCGAFGRAAHVRPARRGA
jgi:bacteriophage N4 adsorption protein B